jgi:hypothetical protein
MKKPLLNGKLSALGLGLGAICMLGIAIYSSRKSEEAREADTTARALTQSLPSQGGQQNLTPQQQFEQHIAFERDTRNFARDYANWPLKEREARARDLALRISEREKNRYLSAGEALKLKVMLIRAIEPDEQKQMQRISDMVLRYQADAERRQNEFVAGQQQDPRFQAYKAREAQIVAEVQAMQNFPAGMSREDYLRQRLLEARAAIYYTPQSGK